jgi:hypothetical protein
VCFNSFVRIRRCVCRRRSLLLRLRRWHSSRRCMESAPQPYIVFWVYHLIFNLFRLFSLQLAASHHYETHRLIPRCLRRGWFICGPLFGGRSLRNRMVPGHFCAIPLLGRGAPILLATSMVCDTFTLTTRRLVPILALCKSKSLSIWLRLIQRASILNELMSKRRLRIPEPKILKTFAI